MLLIGPPGSGKTHFVLEALEAAVREGRAQESKLIVPTTSMAQHLLHTLARRGLVVPGNLVQTLANFVREATPDAREISPAMEAFLLKEALRQVSPAAFSGLEASPGLRARIAQSMQEFWAAGAGNLQLDGLVKSDLQRAFLEVFRRFEELLAEAGLVHRNQRIAQAAASFRRDGLGAVKRVYLDGFFRFTQQEQVFVEALAEQSESIVITLPDGLAPYPFQAMGSRLLPGAYRPAPLPEIVAADSPRDEVLEIARRILADGRPLQQCGIVLRSQPQYAPLIEEVFGALRIPFRMRSERKLADHGVVRYLRRWLAAVGAGFPAEAVLELVCSPLSPVGGFTDAFDFAVRQKLPGAGIDLLKTEAGERADILKLLDALPAPGEWPRRRRSGREWAQDARQLRSRLLKRAKPVPDVEPDRVLAMKERARAEAQFDAALDAAAALGRGPADEPIAFAAFLERLDEALAAAPLSTPDDRREVVQVLSVYEARQWALPVVFVCGLVEGWFPRKHAQDVFFPDTDRARPAARGIALRTTADRAEEEKFFYRMATTRATEKLTLTYPRADETGNPLLRSFFLDRANDGAAPAARTSSLSAGRSPRPTGLQEQDLAAVAERSMRFSPTGLDTFLQCPYRYFAGHTLRLKGRPEAAGFRFGAQTAGSIVHKTIHLWSLEGGSIGAILDRVFADALAEAHLHLDFRAALMRVNMRADLERFARESAALSAQGESETDVEYMLDELEPPAAIAGRVDRYRIDNEGRCFVIDYKYSSAAGVKSLRMGHVKDEQLQLPLYMLGLQQEHRARPGGMALCGIRGSTSYEGWSVVKDDPSGSVALVSEESLQRMTASARTVAARVIRKVRTGAIAVAPRDTDVCKRLCEYKAVCRIGWDAAQRADDADA